MSLRAAPDSAAAARRFVAATLRDWGCDHLAEVAVLLASELVTNGILHARSDVVLSVHRAGDGVRVEVRDGSVSPPVVRHYADEAMTGRGLSLVNDLASKWGVTQRDDGKSVWFELAEQTAKTG